MAVSKFGWPHYDKPVYWTLPDDGASIKCADCKRDFKCKDVVLAQSPDDNRQVLCDDCIDEDWKANAEYLGDYKL